MIAIIIFATASCGKASDNKSNSTKSTSSKSAVSDKLTQEAIDLVKERVDKVLIRCGDYWYLKIPVVLDTVEYRRFKKGGRIYETYVQPLSEADKLNGVEWKVDVKYETDNVNQVGKMFGSEWTGWSDWRDGGLTREQWLIKKNGKWTMEKPYGQMNTELNCEEIQKLKDFQRSSGK